TPRRAHAVAGSCQQLGVPIEYRPSVDGERVAEPLPEAAGPRVTAVDAGEHAPSVPVEASFEVARARSADAMALQPRQDQQQVDGGVTLVRVVEFVVEVAGHSLTRQRIRE